MYVAFSSVQSVSLSWRRAAHGSSARSAPRRPLRCPLWAAIPARSHPRGLNMPTAPAATSHDVTSRGMATHANADVDRFIEQVEMCARSVRTLRPRLQRWLDILLPRCSSCAASELTITMIFCWTTGASAAARVYCPPLRPSLLEHLLEQAAAGRGAFLRSDSPLPAQVAWPGGISRARIPHHCSEETSL